MSSPTIYDWQHKAALDKRDTEHGAEVEKLNASHARALAAERAVERARIAGILNHAEAATRPTQAKALAFETDLAVETVGRILSNSPAEATGRRIPSIEERAAGLAEFGESFDASPFPSKTGAFDRAIEIHNRNVKK